MEPQVQAAVITGICTAVVAPVITLVIKAWVDGSSPFSKSKRGCPIMLEGKWEYKRTATGVRKDGKLASGTFPEGELIHGGTLTIEQKQNWWGVSLTFHGTRTWQQKGRRGKVTQLEQVVLWRAKGWFISAEEIEYEYETTRSREGQFKGRAKGQIQQQQGILKILGHFEDSIEDMAIGDFELCQGKRNQSSVP